MKLCPIAVVASCAKCPVVKVCPLKGVIGDFKKAPPPVAAKPMTKSAAKPAARPAAKRKPASARKPAAAKKAKSA